jgi:hypothetical protein
MNLLFTFLLRRLFHCQWVLHSAHLTTWRRTCTYVPPFAKGGQGGFAVKLLSLRQHHPNRLGEDPDHLQLRVEPE